MNNHHLKVWAQKIAFVLENDDLSGETRRAIEDIIFTLANENNVSIAEPQIIEIFFPMLIESGSVDYGRGVLHSLQSIIDGLPDLEQFEIRENEAELKNLASQISEIVANPLLPTRLYNAIVDEIAEVSEKLHTPNNILYNLKLLREKE